MKIQKTYKFSVYLRMKKIIYFIIVLSLFQNLSCSSGIEENKSSGPGRVFDTSFVKAVVHPKISCRQDTGVSYALYLPASYSVREKYPVVIFFDSHAKGIYPVEKYKAVADRFGWITAGSNNSKNGMPAGVTNDIGEKLKKDLLQRFSVDEKNIFVSGFSGGARAAGMLAVADASYSGVIGCSAGIQFDNTLRDNFQFVGIAGLYDMNYNELVRLDKSLENAGVRHYLLTFDGKHEWAPEETMEEAFLWLHLAAVKNNKAALNNALLKSFEDNIDSEVKLHTEKKDYYHSFILLKKADAFLTGIKNVSKYREKATELGSMPEIMAEFAEIKKAGDKETSLQQAYMEAIQAKDPEWWKAETAKLNERLKNAANTHEKEMFSRVLGFLSLVSYSYVNRFLQTGDIKAAEHFNEIYGIIDPAIPDQKFFSACIFAARGKKNHVFTSLREAVRLGLNDRERLTENNFLKPYASEVEFKKILGEINNQKQPGF